MPIALRIQCRPGLTHLLVLSLLAMTLSGCFVVPSTKGTRANSLEAYPSQYRKMMRWAYYDEATQYLRSRDGSEIPTDLARLSRYRVTKFEIRSTLVADHGKEARVVAAIEYYEIDSGVLKSLVDTQLWWFDDESQRWFLESPLPALGS